MIRLAIVEDEPILRNQLAHFFGELPDFSVVASCGSAEELLESLDCSIQVALIDLGLPQLSGSDLILALKQRVPEIQCVAHTVFENPPKVFQALRAGAVGYLVKGCSLEELGNALRTLEQGGVPLTPRIARLLVQQFQVEPNSSVSLREQEILGLLSQGHSYKQVGEQLFLSAHTVHTHVKNIYQKLGVTSRQQAVSEGRRFGWF